MMSSITPVGEMARRQRWWLTTAAYLVGSTVGGLALGAVLGAASMVVRDLLDLRAALLVLAVSAAVGLLMDAGRLPLPTWRRQVDERWLTAYRGWVYGLGFGLQLGAGVLTIITASLTWVVVVAAVLTGSVVEGMLVGGLFGLVRALPVLAFAGIRTPERLRAAFRRVEALRDPTARLAALGQGAVGVGALVAAVAVAS